MPHKEDDIKSIKFSEKEISMEQMDPLARIIKYHKAVSEYLETFEKILDFLHDEEAWRKITPIEDFFKQNVIEHFKYEEEKVFTVCLLKVATPELVSLILELQKEHGLMLKNVEEFRRIISENGIPPSKEASVRLNILGREIIEIFLAHALREDDELLPVLERNRDIF